MPQLAEEATDDTQEKRARTCVPASPAAHLLQEVPAVWVVQWEWMTPPACAYEAKAWGILLLPVAAHGAVSLAP